MTLGGMALAVGILVDDATVEIENIHRNLAMGKELRQAILDGAQQIATTGVCLHPLHLHCLRADVFPDRCRPLSVSAAGRERGVRDAGELPASAAPSFRRW